MYYIFSLSSSSRSIGICASDLRDSDLMTPGTKQKRHHATLSPPIWATHNVGKAEEITMISDGAFHQRRHKLESRRQRRSQWSSCVLRYLQRKFSPLSAFSVTESEIFNLCINPRVTPTFGWLTLQFWWRQNSLKTSTFHFFFVLFLWDCVCLMQVLLSLAATLLEWPPVWRWQGVYGWQ